MMTHTTQFKNLSIDKNAIWSDDKNRLTCSYCDKECSGKWKNGQIKTHLALVHFQLNNFENLDNFEISDKKETGQTARTKRTFFCELCGRTYNNRTGLRRHVLIHTGERPFPCMKCDQRFRQKPTLDKHLKIHSLETSC